MNLVFTWNTVLDKRSRSHRPRPYVLDIDLWPWPITLTFDLRRAMAMINTHKY